MSGTGQICKGRAGRVKARTGKQGQSEGWLAVVGVAWQGQFRRAGAGCAVARPGEASSARVRYGLDGPVAVRCSVGRARDGAAGKAKHGSGKVRAGVIREGLGVVSSGMARCGGQRDG